MQGTATFPDAVLVRERIGQWITELRSRHGLTVRQLAEQCSLHFSTLSRLENAQTHATFWAIASICAGMQVDFSAFFERIEGRKLIPPPDIGRGIVGGGDLLTLNDLEYIIDELYKSPMEVFRKLSLLNVELLNQVKLLRGQNSTGHKQEKPGNALDNLDISDIYSGIKYPKYINSRLVIDNYQRGGFVLLQDIGVVINELRSENKLSRIKLGDSSDLSSKVIYRIERGEIENIKFKDVIRIDQELYANGDIIRMFWRAMDLYLVTLEFNKYLSSDKEDYQETGAKRADVLKQCVILFRNFQQLRSGMDGWLQAFHNILYSN